MTARPLIIAAHSLGLDGSLFDKLRAEVKPWADLWAPDLAGHGGSPISEFSFGNAMRDWESVANENHAGFTMHLGVGLGALVVGAASARSSSADAIVLISPYVKVSGGGSARIAATETRIADIGFEKFVAEYADATLTPRRSADDRANVVTALRRTGEHRFLAALRSAMDFDGTDLYPQISLPTLILRGEDDVRVGPEGVREVGGLLATEVHTLTGAGHLLPLEEPHRLVEMLRAVVSRARDS
ncbi:alpha/beta fold hydrolase [Glaciibacter superstes]|uniref:alpha/beta fold hydrolase n=1 Tax=Glaciibacter superstes TaxID=501023 RepID=UPI0003B3DF9D|nr:alpha/beta hydrolase [Glaciibacter superstes]